jgi:hypothetical protein
MGLLDSYKVDNQGGLLDSYKAQPPEQAKKPGLFQGIVQSITQPFTKTAITAGKAVGGLAGIAEAGVGKLFGSKNLQQQGLGLLQKSASTNPVDLGYLGQQAPIKSYAEAAGTGADIGLTLATLGGAGTAGKLGAKVAAQSAIGGGFGLASSLEEHAGAKDTIKNILTSAAVGGAIPLAGKAISKLKQAVTEVLPKALIKAYIPSTKDLTQHVLDNTKLGFTKTMLNDAKTNVKDLVGKLSDVLEPVEDKVPTNNLFTSVAKSYGQTGGGGTLSGQEVKKIISKVVPEVKGLLSKDEISLKQLNTIGVRVNAELGDRFFTAKNSAFSKEVAGAFNQFSRDLIKSKVPEAVSIYDEMGKNIDVRNALQKSTKKFGRVNLRDLISVMAGVGAGITHGIEGALVGGIGGVATERALSSPAVGVGVAKGLSNIGKVAVPEAVKRLGRLGVMKGINGQ